MNVIWENQTINILIVIISFIIYVSVFSLFLKLLLKIYPKIKSNKKLFGNPELFSHQFSEIPDRKSTCNALRHLIDPKHYHGYNIVYPTDIDFIIFPHLKNL